METGCVNIGEIKIDISFQTLYRYVLDDLYEHPSLDKDVRELQKLYQLHRTQWVTLTFFHILGHETQGDSIHTKQRSSHTVVTVQ